MPSYCGIPLLVPTEAQAALVQAHFNPLEIHQGVREPYAKKVPLNEMLWPWGARRWAEGWFLCDTDQLAQITAAGGLAGGTLKFDDGANAVTAQVSPLTPRPLLGDPALDRLWLLILVDRRYWWWDTTVGNLDAAPGTEWAAYVSQLATLAGTPITFTGVPAAFGKVSQGFAAHGQRLPEVLDKVASSIQCRVISKTDGTAALQTPAQVRASVDASFGARADVSAGGSHPQVVLSASVKMTFPTTQDGVPSRTRHSLSSSAGFPVGATTAPSPAVTFNSSALATFSAGALTNGPQLAALTAAFATSWYGLNKLRHDTDYVGVYAWQPDGVTDLTLADAHTRAASRHEDEGGGEVDLDAGAGSAGGDEDNYFYTTVVFDTTDLFFAGDINWYIGGSVTINGPGYLIVDAPFKLYDGFWLHYRTYDFSGSTQEDDLDITGDDNDRCILRIVLDRDCVITGLLPTPDGGSGQVICLLNTSDTFKLTVAHDAVSLAGRRILCPNATSIDLNPFGGVILWYDPVTAAWRVVGFCCGGSGGGSSLTTSESGQDELPILDMEGTDPWTMSSSWQNVQKNNATTPVDLQVTLPTAGAVYHLTATGSGYLIAGMGGASNAEVRLVTSGATPVVLGSDHFWLGTVLDGDSQIGQFAVSCRHVAGAANEVVKIQAQFTEGSSSGTVTSATLCFFREDDSVGGGGGGGGGGDVTVGLSTVTGGVSGGTLFDNAGLLGCYPQSGSGAPAGTGIAGQLYIDVSDPSNPQLYYG